MAKTIINPNTGLPRKYDIVLRSAFADLTLIHQHLHKRYTEGKTDVKQFLTLVKVSCALDHLNYLFRDGHK